MEGATDTVSCPPFPIEPRHGSLTLSTLERHVGALVTLGCQATDEELTGSPVLECGRDGRWNGTLPVCSIIEDILTTFIPEMTSTTNATLPVETEEKPVEAVILILWTIGGLLLISLVVLIGCILKTHQKTRRNSARSREGHPSHVTRHGGGPNPGFTNYDEIWTWIPVVTDSTENCRSQVNPSARESSSQAQSQQQAALMSRLRLPSYNEAVRTTSGNHGNSGASSRPAGERITSGHSRPSAQNTASQSNNQNTRSASSDVIEQQPYDTIPADIRTLPRAGNRRYEDAPTLPMATSTLRAENNTVNTNSNSNNLTSVAVTSSSGTALAAARALVHQTSNYQRNTHQSNNLQSPLHGRRSDQQTTNNTRGIQIDTYAAVVESRLAQGSRSSRDVPRASRQSRDRPHRHGGERVQEFQRSSASAFTYYGEASRPRSSNYQAESCRLQSWQMLPSNGAADRYQQQPTAAHVVRLNYF